MKRIGLIAMSGVRAYNKQLMEHGLTLPGFVERSKVIASLPSLGLLTIASYIPSDMQVEYHEVSDIQQESVSATEFDLVCISTFSAQIFEAYGLADRFMRRGIPVVMGGLHVTALPDEAKEHCTSVVAGEGEVLWPRVIEDFRKGQLKDRYIQKPGEEFDLSEARMPRYDLLDIGKYNRLTVQTSRGCSHRCEFCASSILLTSKYKVKPVNKVIDEIRYIKTLWEKPFIEFADDNSFVLTAHYKELLRALKGENVRWFTEADIGIAQDPELLDLMFESGCKQVLIGLESPNRAGVDQIERRSNWKSQQFDHYEAAIRAIQSRGITVNGCFVLGLDGDTVDVFDQVFEFVRRTGLFEVQITIMTAFPGTPLYARLKQEGRIIDDKAWDKCTLFDVNYIPKQMTPQQLHQGIVDLSKKLYCDDFIQERQRNFFRMFREYKHGKDV